MRLLSEGELRKGSDVALMARRTLPHGSWLGPNIVLGGVLIFALLHGWITAAALAAALLAIFNTVIYSMRGTWLCVVENSDIFVGAIAAPLIFKKTTDAMTRPAFVAFSVSDIRKLEGQRIEIVEEAGRISTQWLVLEPEPDVIEKLEATLTRLYSERMSTGRPVQFLLRYDAGKCFCRWDGVKPPLDDFLAALSPSFPVGEGATRSAERIVDVRALAAQPDIERRPKISLLINLGLGQLVLPLLTARNGMSSKDARRYLDSILAAPKTN